jgi:hypothetical protein
MDFFYPEDGGDKLLRKIGSYKTFTALHLRRRRETSNPIINRSTERDIG